MQMSEPRELLIKVHPWSMVLPSMIPILSALPVEVRHRHVTVLSAICASYDSDPTS